MSIQEVTHAHASVTSIPTGTDSVGSVAGGTARLLEQCQIWKTEAEGIVFAISHYIGRLREGAQAKLTLSSALLKALYAPGRRSLIGPMGLAAVTEDALGGIEAQLTAGLEDRILAPVKSHVKKLASLLEEQDAFEDHVKRVEHYRAKVAALGGKIASTARETAALPVGKSDIPSLAREKLNRNNAKLSVSSRELSNISKRVDVAASKCLLEGDRIMEALFLHLIRFFEARSGNEHYLHSLLLMVMQNNRGLIAAPAAGADSSREPPGAPSFAKLDYMWESKVLLPEKELLHMEGWLIDESIWLKEESAICSPKFFQVCGSTLHMFNCGADAWGGDRLAEKSYIVKGLKPGSYNDDGDRLRIMIQDKVLKSEEQLIEDQAQPIVVVESQLLVLKAHDSITGRIWAKALLRAVTWDENNEGLRMIELMKRCTSHRQEAIDALKSAYTTSEAESLLEEMSSVRRSSISYAANNNNKQQYTGRSSSFEELSINKLGQDFSSSSHSTSRRLSRLHSEPGRRAEEESHILGAHIPPCPSVCAPSLPNAKYLRDCSEVLVSSEKLTSESLRETTPTRYYDEQEPLASSYSENMQDQKRDTDQAIDRQKTPNSSIKFDPFIPFGEIPRPNSMRLDEEKEKKQYQTQDEELDSRLPPQQHMGSSYYSWMDSSSPPPLPIPPPQNMRGETCDKS